MTGFSLEHSSYLLRKVLYFIEVVTIVVHQITYNLGFLGMEGSLDLQRIVYPAPSIEVVFEIVHHSTNRLPIGRGQAVYLTIVRQTEVCCGVGTEHPCELGQLAGHMVADSGITIEIGCQRGNSSLRSSRAHSLCLVCRDGHHRLPAKCSQ